MKAARQAFTVTSACLVAGWILWPGVVWSHNPTTTTVLFNREIAAIVGRKCLACHGERTMAMPLLTYEQARPWAVAIKEEVLARRMPPWSAERGYGTFANDFGLTTREIDFLVSWAEGGAPSGEGPVPAPIDHGGHWMLGEPDEILSPPSPVRVSARRFPSFERLIVTTTNESERWIGALDFKPGDTRVVRAAFFSVVETGQWLGGWTPTSQAPVVPTGALFPLPPKAHLALDVFYAGIADDVIDRPRLGLYLTVNRPQRTATELVLRPTLATAPQGTGRFVASATIERDSTVAAIRPELPPTTRSLEVRASRPDGSSDVLLWIPRHRPNWPSSYVMRHPVPLPAGSRLHVVMYTDDAEVRPENTTLTITMIGAPSDATPPLSPVHVHGN